MGVIFNGRRFEFEKKHTEIRKDAAATAALRKLRSFLDGAEPGLVYFLLNTWKNQGKAITYKELREAIMAGTISAAYLEEWMEDYAKFVTQHLQPEWVASMEAATAELAEKYPEWSFDPFADGVRRWTEQKSAEFVTNVSNTQIKGLQAVVQRAAVLEDMSVDQLSRAIRGMVGLTSQQSVANLRYYTNLVENGISDSRALDLSLRYSAQQSRYRAYNIARTELAYAYNKGADDGIRQAQEMGYMGRMVKVWCTADDERVCPYCGSLEGKVIEMDDDFDFKTKLEATNPGIRRTPPAHPSCRCAVIYREIEPPGKIK